MFYCGLVCIFLFQNCDSSFMLNSPLAYRRRPTRTTFTTTTTTAAEKQKHYLFWNPKVHDLNKIL
jgi:hypothetical protein